MKQLLTLVLLFTGTLLFAQAADVNFKKGISKFGHKDYKGAMEDFTKSIAINPKNVTTYVCRANCKEYLDDFAGAADDYTKAIKLKPTRADLYTSRAKAKYISLSMAGKPEDYNNILADYTKAIQLNPKDTVAYLNRGITKEFLKDYTGSIDDFNKLCEMNPKNGEAYYYKANAEDNAGKKEEACADWDKALELGETRAQPLKAKNCNQ